MIKKFIWHMQSQAYLAATSTWEDPVRAINVPHVHAANGDGPIIPLFYRYPSSRAVKMPAPVMLLISGLDGFRCDFPGRCTNYFNSRGWAIIGAEIPGCGECPANKTDPTSPDRLWSSVLDWIKQQPELDEENVCCWGFSTGGYYSLRAAHTHADRLKGVIAQGLWAHHALDPDWIDIMDHGEYPACLTTSLVDKFGYDSVEAMKADSQKKYSLVDNKILDMPCTKMLLLNGMQDSIYPIEDTFLVCQYGGPKELRMTTTGKHMGEPQSAPIAFEWLNRIFYAPKAQLWKPIPMGPPPVMAKPGMISASPPGPKSIPKATTSPPSVPLARKASIVAASAIKQVDVEATKPKVVPTSEQKMLSYDALESATVNSTAQSPAIASISEKVQSHPPPPTELSQHSSATSSEESGFSDASTAATTPERSHSPGDEESSKEKEHFEESKEHPSPLQKPTAVSKASSGLSSASERRSLERPGTGRQISAEDQKWDKRLEDMIIKRKSLAQGMKAEA